MKNIPWGKVAHYGIAGLALLLGGLAHFGIQIPGVSVDPATAFAFGIGVFGGGHLRRS